MTNVKDSSGFNKNDFGGTQPNSLRRLKPEHEIGDALAFFEKYVKRSLYSREHLEDLIARYKQKREGLRSRDTFSPEEQNLITSALQGIADYRDTQVEDRGTDTPEPALLNYMGAKGVLLSWNESCKQGSPKLLALAPEGELSQQTRDDILDGYARRGLTKNPKEEDRNNL